MRALTREHRLESPDLIKMLDPSFLHRKYYWPATQCLHLWDLPECRVGCLPNSLSLEVPKQQLQADPGRMGEGSGTEWKPTPFPAEFWELQALAVRTLSCHLAAGSLNCKGSCQLLASLFSELAKPSGGEAILTNVKERCEHFRRMGRRKNKHMLWEIIASLMRKRPNHVRVGREETEEANTAPGVWARDHAAAGKSGLFREDTPHCQAEANHSWQPRERGLIPLSLRHPKTHVWNPS